MQFNKEVCCVSCTETPLPLFGHIQDSWPGTTRDNFAVAIFSTGTELNIIDRKRDAEA